MGSDTREMTNRELVAAFDRACRDIQESLGIIYGDKTTRPGLHARHDELRSVLLERLSRAPKTEVPSVGGIVRTEA